MTNSTINTSEVAKFTALASQWWDKNGDLKTLHDINPVRLAYLKQYCSLQGKSVLDVGCGGGILTEAMAQEGAQVLGIDADEAAIGVATIHAKEANLAIPYSAQVIEDMDAGEFDIITCMEMLEHVNQPELVIKHCARLLKSGGFLFLSTINRNLQAYLKAIVAAEYLLKILPRQTHDYQKFIKPAELAAFARTAGLEVQGLQGLGYNPLSRQAYLQQSVQVNYLMCCYKR